MNRRVLVCGSRDWTDAELVQDVLEGIWCRVGSQPLVSEHRMTLIEGGAKGADAIASLWADSRHLSVEHLTFKADWTKYGKGAGSIRNKRMIVEGYPEFVVAFKDNFDWTLSKGGSENMIKQTIQNNIDYMVVGRCG